jgi:hypothetical protein
VQDATPDGRYRLLERIGRNDKGETWRAFDNLTQRVVAVTVLTDGSNTVTILADDGGDTVAKEIPQPAAPLLDYPAYGPQSDSLVEYRAYWSGAPASGGPGQGDGAQQTDAQPSAPKKSRNRRLIVLSSAGVIAVVAAVVAGIVLIGPGHHGGASQASSTSASPAAPANTGPLTGTFTVHMDQAYLGSGAPNDAAEAKPWTEVWPFRSACSANGCVATATGGDHADVESMVFDNVGGRWLAVGISHVDCGNPNDEAWNVISLAPQPDGTLSGESTRASADGCFMRRNVTLTRKGDADISQLPDPTHLDPRAVSPAEALRGRYDGQITYADGHKTVVRRYGVRTDCLRTGDRCMSFFLEADGGNRSYVFANGTWTRNEDFQDECSSGGTYQATFTSTMALPQPPQDPIGSLVGHGYDTVAPGSNVGCPSQAFDQTFSRTGD